MKRKQKIRHPMELEPGEPFFENQNRSNESIWVELCSSSGIMYPCETAVVHKDRGDVGVCIVCVADFFLRGCGCVYCMCGRGFLYGK